jgi:hypothetical protein
MNQQAFVPVNAVAARRSLLMARCRITKKPSVRVKDTLIMIKRHAAFARGPAGPQSVHGTRLKSDHRRFLADDEKSTGFV